MKKLILTLLACLLLAGIAGADDWHATNQVTVRWDAVTTLIDDRPIPEGDVVTYSVYTRSVQSGAEVLAVPDISVVETSVTFIEEGDYHIGVRAIRTVPPVGEIPERVFYRTIGWSDDPLIVKDGVTFGVSHYVALSNIGGLEMDPPQI